MAAMINSKTIAIVLTTAFGAGVSDLEEAEALLDFAKRFEIIRKAEISSLSLSEVDFADEESIAAGLPKRGARVVVALGDTVGRQRVDARVALRILEAAKVVDAAQFVLVSPSGGGGGAGFLGGLFGGGAPNSSKDVVNSGISCVVLRVGKTEGVDEILASESSVVVGAQQSLPPGSVITKGQATSVAQVVAQVLRQAQDDVAVEAWADKNAEPRDLASLVAEVLPSAIIQDAGGAAEEPEVAPAEEEEESEDAAPFKLPFSFGGQGTQRVKAQAAAAPIRPPAQGTARIKAAVQEEAQKGTRRVGGFFGRAKEAVEEAAEEEQPQKKASPFANLLGGGTQKVAAKAEAAAQKAEAAAGKQAKQTAAAVSRGGKRAAAAAEAPAKQSRGLFGGGKAAAPVEQEAEADSNPFARLLGGGKKAAQEAQQAASKAPAKAQQGARKAAGRAKAAAAKAAPSTSEQPASKKKGGFLQSLGIGQETFYSED
ncbi:hypothetical protein COCSUDRAFT_55258 [Coccomyxa subellipsoidea C-169]|uniref:NAD(P)-binding domain-containing protein n=1 Tax=Coccomyxa subellipsoidea (strain C-169) TaxID=574566 RepID=I0Z9C0_COCSC|nr:hypothetical protein COCSUDRAFT_55258 [Coccomyxa subellipsoidea C-169]EIE27239.1 hypothetical protein COCSUDRAFT_55258 [Coccomyxa subellipsoidea C-169]|eukprot:XP_005651783.1 hypothetical protein COCSUDRAFT_55258 [Coccomyxa subellipsoidea C-169]